MTAQLAIPSLIETSINNTDSQAHNIEVFWWKTYPPPNFLLGSEPSHPATNKSLNISTVPLKGYPQSELVFMLMQHMPTCDPSLIERLFIHKEKTDIFVVAPLAAWRLAPPSEPDQQAYKYPPVSNFSFAIDMNQPPAQLQMTNLAVFRKHINLDDLDFGDDGLWPTLERVVGRRGLGVWKVDRICGPIQYVDAHTGQKLTPDDVKLKKAAIESKHPDDMQSTRTDSHQSTEMEQPVVSSPSSVASTVRQAVSSFSSNLEQIFETDAEKHEERTISTTTIPANFSEQEVKMPT